MKDVNTDNTNDKVIWPWIEAVRDKDLQTDIENETDLENVSGEKPEIETEKVLEIEQKKYCCNFTQTTMTLCTTQFVKSKSVFWTHWQVS